MSDYSKIKEEIKKLVKDGQKLCAALSLQNGKNNTCKDINFFLANYELWYTKSQEVVKQLTPDRIADFKLQYLNPKSKKTSAETYCISDALKTLYSENSYGPWTAMLRVWQQVNMLEACLEKFNSRIYDIQTTLQADVFDSEIESAKHLLKKGFLREAGAICGVLIEKHLAFVCKNRNIVINKKNPTIADYNDKLKDIAYDTIEWRKIQVLGDIRNLCDHSKDKEPTKDEVEELIAGTERIIKTVF
ncbi:hypothetical protein IKR20_01075 [bacterium]|nr:hypothetical protein [bacterium]